MIMRIGGENVHATFPGHNHEDKLKCPYKGCEKVFDKPTVITDNSVIPEQPITPAPTA